VADLSSAPVPPVGPEDHVRGAGEGLIVYADLGCPHCAAAWAELAARPGQIALRHFPVASKHPRSPALHAAAEAAGAQGQFFAMVDSLYADRGHVDDPHLWQRAKRLGSILSASRPTAARQIWRPACGATSNPAFAPGSPALQRFSMPVPLSQLENESSEEKRMAANRVAGGRTTK
jgi:hypothetical protein